jgi:predicted AlkP superfamily pyrophosphatase or phosphodiesterase
MKNIIALSFFIFICIAGYSQSTHKPKLVIGITVDQMRWDYLYRYENRYASNGGFKRMLNKGFSCENTMIPYTPTVTACGHAGIYTGTVPGIHGITGNSWFDSETMQYVYCTDDSTVSPVGTASSAGKMSPANMLTTTICDELKLATNFKSKVIGIALKDRGGILPAGHSADAAYWYDSKSGNWITSSYYMNELPAWVTSFNNEKLIDKYYAKGWNTMYPLDTYTQSTSDGNIYEVMALGKNFFPYELGTLAGKNYNAILATPYGNTFTTEFAKAAIQNEKLGADSVTDFLALSYSSTDYIGHSFGPNSIEAEDCYLRLDKELGEFLDYLDTKIGKDQYVVFLTADHGVAQVPAFMKDNKIPTGQVKMQHLVDTLNKQLNDRYGKPNLVIDIINAQVILNTALIEANNKIKIDDVVKSTLLFLSKEKAISRAFLLDDLQRTTLNVKLKDMIANGYYPKRSGHIQLLFKPQWIEDFSSGGTTHGVWNPYDAHIPLLWYGWNIKHGVLLRETYMTDIAPTLAALLKIQAPNGSIGNVITEVLK